MVVTVNPLPGTASVPLGITALCENSSNSAYTTTATNATSYQWNLTPSGAGSITGTGTTGTVDWNNAYTGIVTITSIWN